MFHPLLRPLPRSIYIHVLHRRVKDFYLSSSLSEWSGPLCSIHFDARRLGVGKQASKQGRRKTGTDLCLRCTTLINREAMQPSSAHVNYIYRRVLLRGEDGGRRNGDIKITRCKSSRRNRKYTHLSLANEFSMLSLSLCFSTTFAFQLFDPI